MRIRKLSAGFLLSFFMLTFIAFAMDVSTDYDHSVDFSNYKTFAWVRPPSGADPFMRQRVEDAINRMLQQKGLQLVSNADDADVGVVANGATMEKHTLQTFYDGYPGGWGWGGWGTTRTFVDTYEEGTLVVDLFDMDSKKVIWRSIATDTLSSKPEKNTKKIDKAIDKMFKDYPPKLS
jgi:hypothetical protein